MDLKYEIDKLEHLNAATKKAVLERVKELLPEEQVFLDKLYQHTHYDALGFGTLKELCQRTGCSLAEYVDIYSTATRIRACGIDNHLVIETIVRNEKMSENLILQSYAILLDEDMRRMMRIAQKRLEESYLPYSERSDYWR
jgi:hypothetical protein